MSYKLCTSLCNSWYKLNKCFYSIVDGNANGSTNIIFYNTNTKCAIIKQKSISPMRPLNAYRHWSAIYTHILHFNTTIYLSTWRKQRWHIPIVYKIGTIKNDPINFMVSHLRCLLSSWHFRIYTLCVQLWMFSFIKFSTLEHNAHNGTIKLFMNIN